MKQLVGVTACLLALSACATDDPLSYACPRFDAFRTPIPVTPGGTAVPALGDSSELEAMIAEAVSGYEDRVHTSSVDNTTPDGPQFLILSGGGQWGAFGAGLMDAWPDEGSNRRPVFDLVTGISTGALQATYAFLGRDVDDELIEAYTIAEEAELVERHGDLFFLGNASTANTAPLDRYVRANLSHLLEQVAMAAGNGRKLLVGVVDATDGNAYAIDMTRIARELEGEERLDCYIGALMASAAIPVVFRQVRVNNRPYFDGGVRHSVFVTEVEEASARMVEAANAGRNADDYMKGTMYIVVNGDPRVAPAEDVPPKLLSALNRTREIAFNQIELSGIFNTASTLPDMRTRVATANGHQCQDAITDPAMLFDPAFMQCLIDHGRQGWAQGSTPWSEFP